MRGGRAATSRSLNRLAAASIDEAGNGCEHSALAHDWKLLLHHGHWYAAHDVGARPLGPRVTATRRYSDERKVSRGTAAPCRLAPDRQRFLVSHLVSRN